MSLTDPHEVVEVEGGEEGVGEGGEVVEEEEEVNLVILVLSILVLHALFLFVLVLLVLSTSIPGGAKSSQKVHAGPQLDEKLFENIRHTGINFDKYDNIAVKVEGQNPPKPVQSIEEAGLNPALANNVAKSG